MALNSLYVGLIIKARHFNGQAEVRRINREMNVVEMFVTGEHDQSWTESWDLAHTETGLRRGDYFYGGPPPRCPECGRRSECGCNI